MTQTTHPLKLAAALALAAVVVVVVVGTGCGDVAGTSDGREADRFLGYGETSPVERLVDRQIASGARTDGTLRPYHFDEATLNSLGQAKVDAMLKDFGASDGVLVVFLDVPDGDDAHADLAGARRDAVTDYLVEQGIAEGSFELESGHNPDVMTAVVAARPPAADTTAPADQAGDEGFGKSLSDAMANQPKK